jgi:tyrosinase
MVGAKVGVTLRNAPLTADVALSQPQGPAAAALAAGEQPRILLNLENVTGQGNFSSFAVYLNVPAAASADDDPNLFAGTLPMFGVREATQSSAALGGSGVTYVLDITDVVNHLKQANNWDPDNLRVTFQPIAQGDPDASVDVGRVSLYYE